MRAAVGPVTASAAAGLVALLACTEPAAAQSWIDLETQRAVIAGIEVVVQDVFDTSRRPENNWIGRSANAVHIETRERVVRRELLFEVGDTVDARRIQETERNLRRLAFVRDARVIPARADADSVWVRVEVADAWSLQADVNLSQTGGNTAWSVRLDEVNLLGRGKRVYVEHGRSPERTASSVGYTDPQLWGSRWVASLGYADLSDGSSRLAFIERPYYSIDTRYAVTGFVTTSERLLTQYNRGVAVHVIPARRSTAALAASHAYRVRNRTAFRLGVTYHSDENRYDHAITLHPGLLPEPDTSTRRLRGFSATWSVVQDRPVVVENLSSIGRSEDYSLGFVLGGGVGYALRALGSVASAPFGDITLRKGWRTGDHGLLLLDAWARGRHEADGWREAGGRVAVTAYRRSLFGQTLAAQLSVVSSTRPDSADWLYLGGRDGLRGYVDHFLAGDRRVVLSLEDRVITSWRPLGLVQAGFVAYADGGAIRRADTGRWSRTYANIGAGLRFGNLKSAYGRLLQVSVAMPIVRDPGVDRALLVLGNSIAF
jgi:hypothetical protein